MSWIVSRLLMESIFLKENPNFESDDYNNLLVIEKKIDSMRKSNLISSTEAKVLSLITEGYLFGDIGEMLGIGTETVSKIYKNICDRISFSLGGEFTDDGYIRAVAKKRHLTDEEIEKLTTFIHSSLRHKILRRPAKLNEN